MKIDQKSIKKGIKNKMQVGMDFGWLLERFWGQVRGQVGAKLAPTSEKLELQDDVKKTSKKRSDKKWAREFGGRKFPGSGAPRKPLAKAKGSLWLKPKATT